jgi:high affinity Mn2+ porin
LTFSTATDTSSSVLATSVQRPSELFKRAGTTSRLTLVAGKFSAADFFDESSYSHDPRTQFLNWSLMSAGAWDYPADTRGYTWGAAAEYTYNEWSFDAIFVLVPTTANGLELDTRIAEAHGMAFEVEYHYAIAGRKGVARALAFRNLANAGNYRRTLQQMPVNPDITQTRRYGTVKYGFVLGVEQELTDDIGVFARVSWNDGTSETWAFTEIDQSLCAGVQFAGHLWKRDSDVLGIASVVNGISDDHRDYLAAGGYGFIIGDGALSYAPEWISEVYYRFQVNDWLQLSLDYQLVVNPAYNQARGPIVHIGALRAHVEF